MPHGHCYLWQPVTLWLNVGSDGLIAAAYFAIPVSLYSLVRRRMTDIPFPAIFLMFAAFILLCGMTHVLEIWTVWEPQYRLGGALKLMTGLVSMATLITLVRLTPLALQLRSPQSLQREVDARTAELAQANSSLQRTVVELERQREELTATHRARNELNARLATTLRSVGDAVISTDAAGTVQFMNKVAEDLTGWTEQEARGKALEQVFRIVNEQTRAAVESPVAQVLRQGTIVGLANHTMLIARDAVERPIVDSGAPITEGGKLVGVVLVFRDSTADRAAERALRISEQRFRAAVQAVQGVLWTNTAQGEMRGDQPGWAALTGQTLAEYQGFGWSTAVHPEDAQPTIDAWNQAVEEKRPFLFEHRIRRYDGQWRTHAIHAIPTFTDRGEIEEWVGVHIDITERRHAEAEQARLAAVAEQSLDFIGFTDQAFRPFFLNAAGRQLIGLADLEAVRQATVIDWVTTECQHLVDTTVVPAVQKQGYWKGELTFRHVVTGASIPVFFTLFGIRDSSGHLVGYGTITRDLTENKRVEAAQHEADRRKDEFLATLSHELRNPLAPIRNAAKILENDSIKPSDIERSRLIIGRQVRHMAALLDDLLDLSRITRGVITLTKAYVNLQGLLAEGVETARPLIDAKRHSLKLDWPEQPVEIEADPVRVVQIVANLLTNAAKYTDPEGEITFGAQADDQGVVIYVRDTGVGLAPETLTEVFKMFSQVTSNQERSEGGLGIGLALVKGLVELHGGRVEARSAGLEQGSEFIVTLPNVRVATGTFALSVADRAQRGVLSNTRRVLVADDNRDSAESLSILLEMAGHQVFIAHNGADALGLAALHRPQIAILDIGMPGMSGYDLAQQIRREAWGAAMLMIAMTGWGQEDDKRRALRAGFDHHLTKPVDLEALNALLGTESGLPGEDALRG